MKDSIIISLIIIIIGLFFDRFYMKKRYSVPYNLYLKSLSLLKQWVNAENSTITCFYRSGLKPDLNDFNLKLSTKLLDETNVFLNNSLNLNEYAQYEEK